MLRTLLLSIFFLFLNPLYSQDNRDLIRLIDPNSDAIPQKTPGEEEKQAAITETQKRLLKKVLESLTDREVDEYLFKLGLSTDGSVYAKRIRLKESLQEKDKKEDPITPNSLDKKNKPPYVIENAGEGEFLSID